MWSAPSAAIPMTVLGWIDHRHQLRLAMGCSSASDNMLHDLDEEMSEEEHQRDEGQARDEQRSGEQHAKEPVVVLEMHVEHHHDRELERRQSEQGRNESPRRDER